jgi:hypothetical protein
MLRTALMWFSVLLMLGGLVASASGSAGALVMSFWGFVLFAAVLFERWRYRKPAVTGVGWQNTDERFVDPETGQLTQVIYNPRTGDRLYMPVVEGDKDTPL